MTTLPTFIPAARLLATRARRRRAVWALIITVYGGVAALVCLPAAYLTGSRFITTDEEARSIETRITAAADQTARSTSAALAAESALRIATSLTGHADWSLLLPILADILAGRATLDSLALEPVSADHTRYTLTLRGRAADQRLVSDIALGFEKAVLFRDVRVLESRNDASGSVAFAVQLSIAPADNPDKDASP